LFSTLAVFKKVDLTTEGLQINFDVDRQTHWARTLLKELLRELGTDVHRVGRVHTDEHDALVGTPDQHRGLIFHDSQRTTYHIQGFACEYKSTLVFA
jgi:hypothetical protein